MKKNIFYSILLLSFVFMAGCKKNGNYPGAVISPYVAIFDVRDQYKGKDLTLSSSILFGSSKITGIVVSDHSGNNMPSGLLVIQDRRRLGELRGISLNIGADAASFVPGDSVVVNVEGGVLTRDNGILQIKNLTKTNVTKISSGNAIPVNQVQSNLIIANPDKYESTFLVIVKAGFNPLPAAGDVLKGDKMLNDGFGDITLHTEASATFANTAAPFLANFYGIVFNTAVGDKLVPQLRMRKASDVVVLSSTITLTPVIISGFISDVIGGDGNYEYVQFLATRDINFATTPFSVVFTNNANASIPTGYPANGWATGNMRTYKINITSGTAAKGTLFYIGGTNKMINGAASTSIASVNWVKTWDPSKVAGDDFGTTTGGLLANSGNASGIAVFAGTTVTANSVPVDVIMVGNSGSLYTTTPSVQGYRIAATDWYDVTNPITLEEQPFYRSGSNTLNIAYTTGDLGYFYKLGGEYNVTLGRWVKARSQTNVLLSKTSVLSEIEGTGVTVLK